MLLMPVRPIPRSTSISTSRTCPDRCAAAAIDAALSWSSTTSATKAPRSSSCINRSSLPAPMTGDVISMLLIPCPTNASAIVENKRLGHTLALIKAQQDSHFEVKIKTNSEKGEYQKRGRQIYGPDYVPKIPTKPAAVAETTARK